VGLALPRALSVLLAAVLLIEVFVIVPRGAALLLIGAAIWLSLPGVWLVRAAVPARDVRVMSWLLGPAIGLGFSMFGMLLVWAAGLQNWGTVLLGPLLTWVIAWLVGRAGGWGFRLPTFDRRDLAAVVIALAIVPAITWAPYDHVREQLPEGEAYRAYFTADFVWAMTVTSELAKGHVPPLNPFLRGGGETLHYYWMAHFLSGVLYHNVASAGVLVEQVVLVDGLVFGLAFAAFMYALARLAGASPAFAALAVIVGFAANSYEGINRIWVLSQQGVSFEALKDYNIDAVTRWFYNGMPVDGLQRLLLYQPHHLTGYVMGLAALWIVGFAEDVREIGIALAAGILLGLAFLFSTFTAIIIGCAIGLLYAFRLIEQRAWSSLIPCAILGGGPAVVGALLTRVLGYTDPQAGSLMQVVLNPVATRQWPFMLFLSFGPLLIAGAIGLARVPWVRREGAAAAALVVASFAFYFLIDVADMEGVWVGWRSGHQLLIAFSVIGGAALTAAWQHHRLRIALVTLTLLACVPAVPTVAIDVYNAQDIWNRNPGPSFPWTLLITRDEREAFDWVKRATPAEAVVQPEMVARGNKHWAYLPAFGERHMAAGQGLAMIPFRKYQQASEAVKAGLFEAASAADAHRMAQVLHVDYVWMGAIERRTYQHAAVELAAHPDLFRPVFKNDEVTIYAVAGSK
jgi:hypothetical protein